MADIIYSQAITVKAAPAEVWRALVDPRLVQEYHLAPLKEIELRENGRIAYGTDNEDLIVGTILKVEIDQYLEHTFRFEPFSHEETHHDEETFVSYQITEDKEGTTLTLSHWGFAEENQTYANVCSGWPVILSGLESFLQNRAGSN
jgi:uncharacterized protein YndB with AHSA1/START domain